ncbi:hypothetical protein [Mucilaginibacter auburnensis]|uniref:Uncharacterized protein n=1 Tax=Mucilaginibacter auburnensis TaxID=1457233 RepID=A0A2H9VSQ8_9SPHI|nr:hypothetical protein [Mucilaginibacter auburnensis]PJJ83822.1 hypothetical protein CLV57_0817 [Mucilaginibacter auburnensis]
MDKTTSPQKKKFPRWPFIVLGFVLIIGAAAWYAYNHYFADNRWKPILQAKLKEMVQQSSDSLYRIEYSDFDVSLASGDVTLSDFKLVPDTAVYNKLVSNKKAPDNLFMLSVNKLTIKNIGAKKAYQDKILAVNSITIDKPDLTVINKRYAFNDTVKVGKPQTPYEIIKKAFKELRIDSISLKDISLNYINKNEPVTKQTAIKNLNINISGLLVDSLSAQDSSRFYYTKGIEFIINNYKVKTPDSLYTSEIDRIYFSTAKRMIQLDKVNLKPRYSRAEFYEKKGEGGDIFTLKFKKIAITDIDLQRFLRDQKLYAGVMDIEDADVNIYANGIYKGKKTSKIGKDPHQALQKVALDMKLSRLNIKKTDITYAETDATTRQTGVITFKNTNGHFLNVTNDPDVKRKNHFMTASINTYFMDAAPLNVNFKFDLAAKNGAFNYSGHLGGFDGGVLNRLVKPLAMVQVRSAKVKRLDFNIDATNYGGKGIVKFYYKDLNVQLLKKAANGKGFENQGLLSTVANSLIIENDNPDSKGVFRPGPVNMGREPTVSFFSFLYKGLLEGIKPSIGLDKKTEGSIQKVAEKVSSVLDQFKKFKENRKLRREERRRKKEQEKALEEKEKAKKEAEQK